MEETIVERKLDLDNYGNNNNDGNMGDDNPAGNGGKKNNRNILIAVIVAVVLCCCCLVAVGAGYYAFITIASVESSPSLPNDVVVPQSNFGDDNPPKGGLGNDILKNDTWRVMSPAAVALGCDRPVGANSTIEVIQQPDANGVWVEHWNVACQSGDTYLFEVQFILDDSGATFNITPLQK